MADMQVSDRLKWLLAIIKLSGSGYVEGSTRLQKLAFLAHQQIKDLAQYQFYQDWFPSNYGPMSKDLADDVKSSVNNLIVKSQKKNSAGFLVDCFSRGLTGTRSSRISWHSSKI